MNRTPFVDIAGSEHGCILPRFGRHCRGRALMIDVEGYRYTIERNPKAVHQCG